MRYNVISTDDHFVEPADLWQSRVPEAMKDAAPKAVLEDDGFESWYMDNKRVRPVGYSSIAGKKDGVLQRPKTFADMRPGCYDPAERLKDMDFDGVDAQVLYPNVAGLGGQGLLHIQDIPTRLACVRAYNDGLADWCSTDWGRFLPNCLIPMWDIALIPDEISRAAKLGHKGIVFAGAPENLGYPAIWDRYWDPLWSAAQDVGIPVALHIGGNAPTQDASRAQPVDRPQYMNSGFGAVYTIAGNITIMSNILFSGILQRFPKVKIVSVESGVGWIPYLLETADHQWEEHNIGTTTDYTDRPSDLFRRHIYTNIWFEKEGIKDRHYIGINNIMWECDYPHPTGIWPRTKEYIADVLEGIPDDERELILWKNAVALYQLSAS